LERHQNTSPKLDAIRCEVVAGLNRQDTKAQSRAENLESWCLGGSNKLWLELIWPCRRIWTGLAAIWILIFAVNFSQRDPSKLMARKTPPSPQMILAFRQQEKLLAELIGQNEPQAAEQPKTFSPRPSSERSFKTLTV
jgi:hypothetical protein